MLDNPPTTMPENWQGFGFNAEGVMITRSGYRCTPQSLEAALWLFGCWSSDSRRYLIHSDEAPNALRQLYDIADADDTASTKPTRYVVEKRVQRE